MHQKVYLGLKLSFNVAAGALLLPQCLLGAAIPGLFNTGVDAKGALLASGAVDPHYRIVQSVDPSFPGPNAYVVVEAWPIPPWVANGPGSKWIAPQADQSGGNRSGDYVYRLQFDLTGLDPTTATISGKWTSDNTGTGIRLNGVNLGFSNDGDFSVLATPFSITSGFVDGTNTLDFVVNNAPADNNPTGLRVELSGSAEPLPPPGTPPSILTPPSDQAVQPGERATFSIRSRGAPPMSYQWRKESLPIAGATNASFSIYPAAGSDVGGYDVVVSNPWGVVTSTPPAVLSLKALSPAELGYESPGPSSRRTGLAITEIMYHPGNRADGRNLEFVELYNSNPFPEDLSGWRLSGEWDFVFPNGTLLPGFAYAVVTANAADLLAVYGPLPEALVLTNPSLTNVLSNSSGTVRLRKPSGGIVLEVEYSDRPPWPVAADGTGHSLVLARPSYGEGSPYAWAASGFVGGSPGSADPIPSSALENILINEFLAHTDPPQTDYLELYNHSALPVDVSGCVLTDDPATNRFTIPAGTIIPSRGFLVYTQATLGFALAADGETLYFKNPSGSRVIDAVRFAAQENGVAMGRYPDGNPGSESFRTVPSAFHRLASLTPGTNNVPPRPSPIVINELMYHHVSGDDDLQYVELFNPSAQPVSLAGWRLDDGISYTFPTNASIPAGGFLVVARDAALLVAHYGGQALSTANCLGNFTGRLAHNGERVALTKPDLIISTNATGAPLTNTIHIAVDEVTYGTSGRWPRWADGGGSSLELVDARSNHRLAPNWADSDESAKSGWTTVEITGVLDHGNPSVPNPDQLQLFLLGEGEALVDNVEVFLAGGANRLSNPGFESGSTGWHFQGTHRSSGVTNGAFAGARALLVRASDRGNVAADRIRAPLTSAFSSGQTATLKARARWLRGSPELLLRLKGGHLEVVGRLAIPPNLGTPGAANSRARANTGPAITGVSHRPVLPQAGDSIRVTASVDDPDGLQSVVLRYRLDPSSNLTSVTMMDDGTGGDLVGGDGVFTGVIPAQAAGSLVAFRIEATDRFAPSAIAQFPALDGTSSTVNFPPECLVRVGDPLPPAGFGSYRVWITQSNFDFWAGREKLSGENVDATFVYGTNRVCYNMGARFGGSPFSAPGYTTPTGSPCGYSLDFREDNPFLGSTSMVLDYLVRDPTGQREQLMYWFLEHYGLPNNYRRFVHLYVDGVRRGVIYEDTQRPGQDPLKEWFADDPDGSLFKTDYWDEFDDGGTRQDPGVPNTLENFTTTGGVKKTARYRWCWEPRAVGRTADDFTNLFLLVDAVNAPEPGYLSAIEGLIDLEHWMRTFCMNDLASYWDGFGNPNTKNTYLYKPKADGWKLMSWDFDVGLGVFNDPVDAALFPSLSDPAMNRLYAVPGVVRHYWRALDEALSTFFKVGPGTQIDRILDAKYAAFQTYGIGLSSPDPIKTWISQRRSFLLSQLATVAATFSVSGPASIVTNRNAIVLSGTAPVTAETIAVNGAPVPVTWTGLTSWRITVPITNTTATLLVQALDRLGQPIAGASRSISVTYTGAFASPEDSMVINEIMSWPATADAEFIELFNRSTSYSFDLSGWRINGLDYTFPSGSVLTNQQLLVLAKDRAAFGAAYGWATPVHGLFDGNLQADGETLTLLRPGANGSQSVVGARVRYESGLPWPPGADGTGSSYQLIDPAQDNWRAGNWAVTLTNPPAPQPGWVYVTTTGAASSSTLYLYLQSAGDILVDDLQMVAGSVAGVGANLIANGGFESALGGTWTLTANFTQSTRSPTARSGSYSLRMVATAPGSGNGNAVYQTLSPGLTSGQTYTLSFWYLQSTNGGPLTVRLSGSGITTGNIHPAPPAMPPLVRATPGLPNSVRDGIPPFAPIWINEVQAENLSGITNRAGQRGPWLELYNPTTNTVSLAGHFLSASYLELPMWPFPPETVVGPGQFKVIFADGQSNLSTADELHTSFSLPPASGQVVLSRARDSRLEVLDYLPYQNLRPDRSRGSFPDAQSFERQDFSYVTPGGTNNGASGPLQVFINEWMADNMLSLADPADNSFEDWFEVYNPGPDSVDLGGCLLTDTLADPTPFEVPDNGRYIIPPDGFLLVWADGEPGQNSTNRADLHVDFKLDKQLGDAIYLLHRDRTVIDAVTFGPQTTDVSEGRFPDGNALRFSMPAPTPRQPNLIPNTPPAINPIAEQFVHAGQTLQLAVTATDAESAVQRLTFSLDSGAPAGAVIDPASGLFRWTASGIPVPGTNTVSVRVTDSGTPPLNDARLFTIVTLPMPQPAAQLVDNIVRISFNTLAGHHYQVQYKNDLADPAWLPFSAWLQGTGALLEVDDDVTLHAHRFFRINVE